MSEPKYYLKYREIYNDESYSVDQFLETFEVDDWKQLFSDLTHARAYPTSILQVVTDLDVTSAFSSKIKYAPQSVKSKVNQALIEEIDANIELENPGTGALFSTLIEISRFLESGLPAAKLIKLIILDNRHNYDTRFNAALALARYKDSEASDFWIGAAKELLLSNQFLSFPRFLYFSTTDTLEAVYSLRYFEKTEYINEDDLLLQISYFLSRISGNEAELDLVKNNYFLFGSWLQEFIYEKVLAGKEFADLKNQFTKRSNIEALIYEVPFFPVYQPGKKANLFEIKNVLNSINERIRFHFPITVINNFIISFDEQKIFRESNQSWRPIELNKSFHDGRHLFKKSQVSNALNLYKSGLDDVYKKREFDRDFLSIYPRILTDFAYIYSSTHDFRNAKQLLFNSIQICQQFHTSNHQELITENTINILGLSSFEPHLNPTWDQQLLEMTRGIDFVAENRYGEMNSGEIYYYLCNGYYRTRNSERFYISFNKGIELAKKSNNTINEIKLSVLRILLENTKSEMSHLKHLIDELDPEERKDPRITSLLPLLKSTMSEEENPLHEIEIIFNENGIVIS